MVRIIRHLVRSYVKRMSPRRMLTTRFIVDKYKTDPRTAALALEKLQIEGKLKSHVRRMINSFGYPSMMRVYQKP